MIKLNDNSDNNDPSNLYQMVTTIDYHVLLTSSSRLLRAMLSLIFVQNSSYLCNLRQVYGCYKRPFVRILTYHTNSIVLFNLYFIDETTEMRETVHKCMLEDTVRNEAYRKAIFDNKEVFRGKKVLDIGAGTGILSVFCAQAGAALVYAVEASKMYKLAEEIVEENNFKEVIKVIHGAIEDVSLPNDEKVDIIISEWMGHLVLHEGMLDSVIKARDKFLRPNGLIFPENVTLYSAPCQVPSLNEDWENVSGVSMVSFCKELRSKCLNSPLIVSVKPEHLLSEPEIILWLDLREVTIGDINCNKIQHLAIVDKPGRYQGICLWFTCSFPSHLSEPVVLSTHPEEPITHWKQTIVVLPINLLVEIGEPLAYEIIFERSILDNRKYCLKVEMLDVDEVPHPEYCNCFKTKCILAKAILEKYENN